MNNRIGLYTLCICFLFGCEKPVTPPADCDCSFNPTDGSLEKAWLSGEWYGIKQNEKGDTYVFSANDTMYLKPRNTNDIHVMTYRITGDHAMEVKKLWPDASGSMQHTVSFLSDDTLCFSGIQLVRNHTEALGKRLIGKWQLVGEGYYEDGTLTMNPSEHTSRYVEFREDLQMVHSSLNLISPYRIEGNILYENYVDEGNTFVYRLDIIDDILILDCIQGNIPDVPRAITVCKYKLIKI
ncbi:MAG: hypothetical protein K2O01_00720 [Bacteroidales bacterium]|nr:hypothetical protein [Bacteroidales bacterium]